MISDSYIVPECVIGRGSFGGLMALYESNYIKFSRLIGDLRNGCDDRGDHYFSSVPADCGLHLHVESRSKYTRIMRMTYWFAEADHVVADPDLRIRVYLDARMTEVAGWASHHQHSVLRDLAQSFTREVDKRWSRNMMLSKWLDYLTEKGHSFRETDPCGDDHEVAGEIHASNAD
jgi:uncharacterized protein YqiB (DUF1249 family)